MILGICILLLRLFILDASPSHTLFTYGTFSPEQATAPRIHSRILLVIIISFLSFRVLFIRYGLCALVGRVFYN